MLPTWTPRDYAVLLVSFTASLCLLILVLGTMLLVMRGVVTPQLLGAISSVGAGAGLVGLGLVLYLVIQTALNLRASFHIAQSRLADPKPWIGIHLVLVVIAIILMFWTAISAPGIFERSAQTERQLLEKQKQLQNAQQSVEWLADAAQSEHGSAYDISSGLYGKALTLNPNNADLWELKGYALYKTKQYPSAVEALEKSITINPNVARAYVDLANVYCVSGDPEKAEANLHRALQMEPGSTNSILRGSELTGPCTATH